MSITLLSIISNADNVNLTSLDIVAENIISLIRITRDEVIRLRSECNVTTVCADRRVFTVIITFYARSINTNSFNFTRVIVVEKNIVSVIGIPLDQVRSIRSENNIFSVRCDRGCFGIAICFFSINTNRNSFGCIFDAIAHKNINHLIVITRD